MCNSAYVFVSEYTLHIREGVGHWLKIPLSPSNKVEYKVGGLVAGAHYKLYVTAKNNYGDSGPSEVVTFRTEPESKTFFNLNQNSTPNLPVFFVVVIII